MSNYSERLVPAIARWGAIACAVVALASVILLIAYRLPYPYEIEWMEGGVLDHVRRVMAGKPLYVAPSLEFVPFIYPPGFYYAASAVTQIAGDGFLPLRIVSALSFLGCVTLLFSFVWRETRDRDFAVISGGLFAATFQLSGGWFDVGRVDMLFLLLILSAFYLLRFGRRPLTFIASGILLAAAFMTKQSAAVIAMPVIVWLVLVRWRMGALVIAVAGLTALAATLLLNDIHGGWYLYYAFELPSGYRLWPDRLIRFWTRDLLPTLPIALSAGVAFLCIATAPMRGFYFAMAAGLVTGAWMSRANDGGYYNVLIPAHAAFSLLAGLGLSICRPLLLARLPARLTPVAWLYAIAIAQFLMLAYNPMDYLPRLSNPAAGDQLVTTIRETRGQVWVPYHSYLVGSAGKPGHAHWMAVSDILRYGRPKFRDDLIAEINAAIAERHYEMIVLSSYPFPDFPPIGGSYTLERDLFGADKKAFLPLAGAPRRPEKIYRLK